MENITVSQYKTRLHRFLAELEKKAKEIEQEVKQAQSERSKKEGNKDLISAIVQLRGKYRDIEFKNALLQLGLIDPPKTAQGLDRATLKRIREEVYGIF